VQRLRGVMVPGQTYDRLSELTFDLLGMQHGGMVMQPTVAALAEKGTPELVLPLDRAQAFFEGMGGGGDTYINIDLSGFIGDRRELIDAIHEGLLAKGRRSGRLGMS
jgi:hypothetical protein